MVPTLSHFARVPAMSSLPPSRDIVTVARATTICAQLRAGLALAAWRHSRNGTVAIGRADVRATLPKNCVATTGVAPSLNLDGFQSVAATARYTTIEAKERCTTLRCDRQGQRV